MPRMPIVSTESNTSICLPNSLLPTFYMEDYTILGLRVGNLGAAVRLLEKNGIALLKNAGYIELSVEQKDQILHIVQLLRANDVSCDIADIVEQVYQG
ncbi:MAG: hypothetical protein PVJ41_13140 [Desulfobacterales bacterium]|jgi:hypothetical protein